MSYRDDHGALLARIEMLERQLAAVTQERDDLLRRLGEVARDGASPGKPRKHTPPPYVQDAPRPEKVALKRSHLEELDQARSEKEQLLLQGPDVPAMANVAERLFRLGDWEGAKALYERMLDMYLGESGRITRAEVYLRVGQILVKMDRRGEALTMYQRGLRHQPTHAELLAAVADLAR